LPAADAFFSRIKKIEKRIKIGPKQKDHLQKPQAVEMLLDLVKDVPSLTIQGQHPFDGQLDPITSILSYVCGEEYWAGPLFKRARNEKHPGYGWIAVNAVLKEPGSAPFAGTLYRNGRPPSAGVGVELFDTMTAIIDCANHKQRWVRDAGLEALDRLKSWFLEKNAPANDLVAWRQALNRLATPEVRSRAVGPRDSS
jgi:hypothetical protein